MQITQPARWMPILLIALGLGLPPSLAAEEPRGEALVRLVPEDIGFCLVLRGARDHAQRLSASPFVKSLRESTSGWGNELRRLEALDEFLRLQLGVDAAKLRDEIFGDCVVLAYRPGPAGKPQQEQGLLLLQARDARLLEKLIETINRAQEQSGEVKEIIGCEHLSEKYFRRVQQKGDDFYAVRDGKLLLATKEEMLREVLGRLREDRSEQSALEKRMRALMQASTLAAIWIQPRAFDAEMNHNLENADGKSAAFLRNFIRYWQAIDGIGLTANLETDLQLKLTLNARSKELPAAARKFFEEAGRPVVLPGGLPADALMAMTGRIQFDALFEMLSEFLPAEDSKALQSGVDRTLGAVVGKDFFKEVVPYLGPNCVFCITPPPTGEKGWFPRAWLAVSLGGGNKADPSLDESILHVIDFAVALAVVGYNQEHNAKLTIRTAIDDEVKMKYVDGGQNFPPGLRPAYALQSGYLTLGSSPEALHLCRTCLAETSQNQQNQPLVRVSVNEACRFLQGRREAIVRYLADKDKIDSKEAEARLEKLLRWLEPVDQIELSQAHSDGSLEFTFRVQPSRPLQKEPRP